MVANTQYKPNLDVFRSLCVLLVIATHVLGSINFSGYPQQSNLFRHMWYVGSFGVTGFFVLSAYLLSSILLKEKELGGIKKSNFYMRRVLRIYPLYFASILTIFIINKMSSQPLDLHLINYVTFTANYASYGWQESSPLLHFWSICVEEQFYLLLPWLLLLSKRRLNILLSTLIPISMVSKFFLSDLLPYPAVWNFSTSHLDSFALGILIALNLNSAIIHVKKVRKLKFILIFSTLLFALICASSFQLVYTSNLSSITYLFAAVIFSLLLVVASFEKWDFRGKNIFIYIGQRSFGLYVFHWPVLHYTKVVSQTELLNIESAVVVLAITLFLSELSFRYLESPFMKARVKFQTVRTN